MAQPAPHIVVHRLQPAEAARAWPLWPLRVALLVLFLGPVVAPLFQATRLWLLADSGALARDLLSHYVCPTPLKSYAVQGFPMAVCARCWGATIGLWVGWFTFRAAGARRLGTLARPGLLERFCDLPWLARLVLAGLPFLLWPLEIAWWPGAPLGALLLNGALAGAAAGLFFCSLWPGLGQPRNV